jgi:magnesium-transporting ATPase (P-type)
MTVVVQRNTDQKIFVYTKGADSALDCNNMVTFQNSINTMSNAGLRTLVFAYKECNMSADQVNNA